MTVKSNNKTNLSEVKFSVASQAVWIPGSEDHLPMPAMLRRRASVPGKMALDAAYRCLGENTASIPTVFCSRHGECERSAELLSDLVRNNPISPTAFSLSVHNATNGLFSIARRDHANSIAIAAGHHTIEYAVIEACGLLADDVPAVLLVAYDNYLPLIFNQFKDPHEQPYAWAWLMQPPSEGAQNISLSWSTTQENGLDWQWQYHD